MTADYHLHSCFSGDSDTPSEEMVRAGLSKGLSLLCFTEHLDLDYPYTDSDFMLNAQDYLSEFHRLKELYGDRVELRFGAELGLQPHLGEAYQTWLSDKTFDFLIGSTHLVDQTDPYYPNFWDTHKEDDGINRYLDVTLENIRAFDGFDVYGHIDYIVRYVPERFLGGRERRFSYREHREQVDAILGLLIEKGKGIEINTGGYKAGLSEPNPCRDVLLRYRELGGEILTIGSDAHTPEYVGYRFEDAKELLRECGFSHFTIFRERKPEFIRL